MKVFSQPPNRYPSTGYPAVIAQADTVNGGVLTYVSALTFKKESHARDYFGDALVKWPAYRLSDVDYLKQFPIQPIYRSQQGRSEE